MMLTAKSGMPLRVYDYLEGKIFMGALLSTEYVSGREGGSSSVLAARGASEAAPQLAECFAGPGSHLCKRPRMLVEKNLPALIVEFKGQNQRQWAAV